MKRLALLLAFTISGVAAAQDPPPGFHAYPPPTPVGYLEQRRWGLFEIGCGVFGAAYVSTIINGLQLGQPEGAVPVVGPILLLDSVSGDGNKAILILDSAAQVGGLTLMILGLTLTRKIPVYAVVPTANGVAIAGRF